MASQSSQATAAIGAATRRSSSHPPWCASIAITSSTLRRDARESSAPGSGWTRCLNTTIDTSTSPDIVPGRMRQQVEKTIEVIRPALKADGGDIILHEVHEETGVIDVELIGACVGCPASSQTLKAGIERIMRDRIEGVTEVNNIA